MYIYIQLRPTYSWNLRGSVDCTAEPPHPSTLQVDPETSGIWMYHRPVPLAGEEGSLDVLFLDTEVGGYGDRRRQGGRRGGMWHAVCWESVDGYCKCPGMTLRDPDARLMKS
jgi:hypothetical protein